MLSVLYCGLPLQLSPATLSQTQAGSWQVPIATKAFRKEYVTVPLPQFTCALTVQDSFRKDGYICCDKSRRTAKIGALSGSRFWQVPSIISVLLPKAILME